MHSASSSYVHRIFVTDRHSTSHRSISPLLQLTSLPPLVARSEVRISPANLLHPSSASLAHPLPMTGRLFLLSSRARPLPLASPRPRSRRSSGFIAFAAAFGGLSTSRSPSPRTFGLCCQSTGMWVQAPVPSTPAARRVATRALMATCTTPSTIHGRTATRSTAWKRSTEHPEAYDVISSSSG